MPRALSALSALFVLGSAAAEEPSHRPEAWTLRAGYSQLRLPRGDERLGLAELSLLAESPAGFYLGPSLQAALRGQRGGFFAAGLEGGLRARLSPRWTVDAGLFLGGGGGAAAPVGGGLALRPHLGLIWGGDGLRLGLGLSHTRFPSGDIRSTEACFSWERTFAPTRAADPTGDGRRASPFTEDALELRTTRYAPSAGGWRAPGGSDGPALDLVGATWTRPLSGPFFARVEASAAARGDRDGYMEVLGGVGARLFLGGGRHVALCAALGAGSGGGGGIDTGGGFLVKGSAGLRFQLGPSLHVEAEAGRLAAPAASFRAATFSLGAGFTLETAMPGRRATGAPPGGASALPWRLSEGFQRYGAALRKDGRPAPLEQLVLKAELQLADWAYVTGQSGWATGGGAGAWATGLLGMGVQTPSLGGHRLRLEAAGGAGGGGGVDSRGGALVQVLAGWGWDFSSSWGAHLMAGRVRAPRGGLSSSLVELGLGLRSSLLSRRPARR